MTFAQEAETATPMVACFSYLAHVHSMFVTAMPPLNYGVDVEHTEDYVAGDGPLVAASLRGLGYPASLHSNPVADDDLGRSVRARLAEWNITLRTDATRVEHTRTNIVVVDHSGNRTWFSGLRGITDELCNLDLIQLTAAPVVYLDCYEVLRDAPRAVLSAALEAGCQVVVNLGGSPPPAWLATTLRGRRIRALQTNAQEDAASAQAILEALCALDAAELTVVTAGRYGAIGHARTGQNAGAQAVPVPLRQTQGAGAAFSAGLIHRLQHGDDLEEILRFACAAGSRWCSRPFGDSLPNEAEIDAFADRVSTNPR